MPSSGRKRQNIPEGLTCPLAHSSLAPDFFSEVSALHTGRSRIRTLSSSRTRRSRSVCAGASSARRSAEHGARDGRHGSSVLQLAPCPCLRQRVTPLLLRCTHRREQCRKSFRISCRRRFATAIKTRTHGRCFEVHSRQGSDGWRHITSSRSCTHCLRSSRCESSEPVSWEGKHLTLLTRGPTGSRFFSLPAC